MSSSTMAIGVAGALAVTAAASAEVWYVDAGVAQPGDGQSWATAFRNLQDALIDDELAEGDQVRVAAGTYCPDVYATTGPDGTNDPDATFELVPGVDLYGGFPPGGGPWASRDPWQHQSVLSGDLYDTPDEPMEACGSPQAGSGNCFAATPGTAGCLDWSCCGIVCDLVTYCCVVSWDQFCADAALEVCDQFDARQVVTAAGIGNRVRVDGFVISGGKAMSSDDPYDYDFGGGGGMLVDYNGDVVVANCTFVGNSAELGGAMYFNGPAVVVNCRFVANTADQGGAIYIGGPAAEADFVNCTFISNSAEAGPGGAVYLTDPAQARLINCTLLDNFGTQHGKAVYKVQEVVNSIIWGSGQDAIKDAQSVSYSCVQFGHEGPGNISEFPVFADALDDDFRLAYGSPCADAGTAAALNPDDADLDGDGDVGEPVPLDLHLARRVVGAAPDMGAFELCPADLDLSGHVSIEDLLIVIGSWGGDPGGAPDYDGDHDVGILDFLWFLSHWTECMPS